MSTRAALCVRFILTILWVGLVLLVMLGTPLVQMEIASALLGSLFFYLYEHPKVVDRLAIVGLAAVFLLICQWYWLGRLELPRFLQYWSAIGFGTWAVVGIRAILSDRREARLALINNVAIPSAAMFVMLYAVHHFVNTMGLFHPRTLDLYPFSFDGSLGFQPSFSVGMLFDKIWWIRWLGAGSYYSILLAMCISYAAFLKAMSKQGHVSRFRMVELFTVAAFLGYIVYNIFPVCGPGYAFGADFPGAPLTYDQCRRLLVEAIPMPLSAPRNGMPSLHMTWALQIWWNLKRVSRDAYWCGFIYAVLTVIGTMGVGEHYLIDLVVAFPFAVFVQAICTQSLPLRSGIRAACLIGGASGLAIWLVLLRFSNRLFWLSPVIPWTLILVTIGGSIFAIRRLQSQENLTAISSTSVETLAADAYTLNR